MHGSATRTSSAAIKQKIHNLEGHEYIITMFDERSGLHAVVAVHSTVLGPAHGGTRMKVYSNEKDAIEDVLNLSKAMSFKSALAGLPYGGAKGVIILQEHSNTNREKLLQAYAVKVDQLNGLFQTGTDVGLTDDDAALMAQYSKYILGLPKEGNNEWTTSNTASRGVFNAIKAAVSHRYDRRSLTDLTIGVKGAGKLGGHLVDLLIADGAKVIIADINSAKTEIIKKKYPGVSVVQASNIHKQTMHVFAPCALGNEFNKSTINELRCEIVAGGANNQLVDDEAGDELHMRNILYIPDYVANAGGLIFVSEDLEKDGFKPERVNKRLANISNTVTMILRESEKTNSPTNRVADMIARKRIKAGKK